MHVMTSGIAVRPLRTWGSWRGFAQAPPFCKTKTTPTALQLYTVWFTSLAAIKIHSHQ